MNMTNLKNALSYNQCDELQAFFFLNFLFFFFFSCCPKDLKSLKHERYSCNRCANPLSVFLTTWLLDYLTVMCLAISLVWEAFIPTEFSNFLSQIQPFCTRYSMQMIRINSFYPISLQKLQRKIPKFRWDNGRSPPPSIRISCVLRVEL